MKKTAFSMLIFLSIVALLARFGTTVISNLFHLQAKAGIKITATPDADVFIEGKQVGKTPYEDEKLSPGELLIKLVSADASWEGKIKLNEGTLSVVNRDLAPSIASSSGEILSLSAGKGVVVTSDPQASLVEADGKVYGQTPLLIPDLSPGDHTFIISHDNYLKRSIRAYLPEKMLLNLNVDLAISEADLASVPALPATPDSAKVVVKQTPTGFLRVRDKPSLGGSEIGRVLPGQSLAVIEDLSSWIKVRLDNGVEGYVSSSYVQKQS